MDGRAYHARAAAAAAAAEAAIASNCPILYGAVVASVLMSRLCEGGALWHFSRVNTKLRR